MRDILSRLHSSYFRLHFFTTKIIGWLPPHFLQILLYKKKLPQLLEQLATIKQNDPIQYTHIIERVNYYNKLETPYNLPHNRESIANFKWKGNGSVYFLDLVNLLKYFPAQNQFYKEFGDVTDIPSHPCLVKSRPITTDNQNSVLLKLDSVRHFYIHPDTTPFRDKKKMLVWRGAAHQKHRIQFLEKFYSVSNYDVGCVHKKSKDRPYYRNFLSIKQQLAYRYILSIEGNDVATNLKWILASNSLCFMVKPKYETWLMEGKLQAGIHYVEVCEDYSDLAEKIEYFDHHPEQAEKIIQNANQYMQQYFNPKQELLISLLVLNKYFSLQKE